MPKIIENVREQLLNEAKKQIELYGYSKTTIRSVAGACGLATGTVYNYFASKDILIASFMLEDWQRCLDGIRNAGAENRSEVMRLIHNAILEFVKEHQKLFGDEDAIKSFNNSYDCWHTVLRGQIADIIHPVCNKTAENSRFLSEFVAESLLCWTIEGKEFDEIYSVLKLIFNENNIKEK